jgi:hypothetical protein
MYQRSIHVVGLFASFVRSGWTPKSTKDENFMYQVIKLDKIEILPKTKHAQNIPKLRFDPEHEQFEFMFPTSKSNDTTKLPDFDLAWCPWSHEM